MNRFPNLRRLSLYTALAGLAALALGELRDGRGFSAGIGSLLRGIASPVDDGSLIAVVCFAAALLLAAADYVVSLYRIAAGTRLAAALTRDAGVEQPSFRERLARAVEILGERRRSAPERASAAIDELFTPIAGDGVTVSQPTPFSAASRADAASTTVRDWKVRAAQRTGVSGQTDRWAMPAADDEKGDNA